MIVTKIVKTNKKVPSLLAGYPQPHTRLMIFTQLQKHIQMLSNMVPTCKPSTAATGALQDPPLNVTQVTLVAFEGRSDSDLQPKKKRSKKK